MSDFFGGFAVAALIALMVAVFIQARSYDAKTSAYERRENGRLIIFGCSCVLLGYSVGYFEGKNVADRYYAAHQNTWPEDWREHSVTGMVLEGKCQIDIDRGETASYWYENYFIQSDKPCQIYPWKKVGKQR